jgi:hypothetical protein
MDAFWYPRPSSPWEILHLDSVDQTMSLHAVLSFLGLCFEVGFGYWVWWFMFMVADDLWSRGYEYAQGCGSR